MEHGGHQTFAQQALLKEESVEATYHYAVAEKQQSRHETGQHARYKHVERHHNVIDGNAEKHQSFLLRAVNAHRFAPRYVVKGHIHVGVAHDKTGESGVAERRDDAYEHADDEDDERKEQQTTLLPQHIGHLTGPKSEHTAPLLSLVSVDFVV